MNRVMMLAMVGCMWLIHPPIATTPKLPLIITANYIQEQLAEEPKQVKPKKLKVETEVTDAEYDLLADLVMAEAENQSWDAQYGVACVVINRMKSDLFPDTIHDVIYQNDPVQFTCTTDGRLNKIIAGEPSDSVKEAVESALEHNKFPKDMLYFTSNGYLGNTKPYKTIDNMYFSLQK